METSWLLLIYTVPARPSRKRAAVWREVKKVGAVYLRDGVCLLPERERTVADFGAIAALVEALGGQADVVSGARLEVERSRSVMHQSRLSRATEYGEIATEAESFLSYLRLESLHRDLGPEELGRLGRDLDKLRVWLGQVTARDYFEAEGRQWAGALLDQCNQELARLRECRGFQKVVG